MLEGKLETRSLAKGAQPVGGSSAKKRPEELENAWGPSNVWKRGNNQPTTKTPRYLSREKKKKGEGREKKNIGGG